MLTESGYVHSDLRGSVIARTGINASNVQRPNRGEAEYDAWGNALAYSGVTKPRYLFTGEEPDPVTGLYVFGARAYDPSLRRWLSPDPLYLVGIERGSSDGRELNLYSYAANNPVAFVDPDGLEASALTTLSDAVGAQVGLTFIDGFVSGLNPFDDGARSGPVGGDSGVWTAGVVVGAAVGLVVDALGAVVGGGTTVAGAAASPTGVGVAVAAGGAALRAPARWLPTDMSRRSARRSTSRRAAVARARRQTRRSRPGDRVLLVRPIKRQ